MTPVGEEPRSAEEVWARVNAGQGDTKCSLFIIPISTHLSLEWCNFRSVLDALQHNREMIAGCSAWNRLIIFHLRADPDIKHGKNAIK